jgi:uncharacterized protein (DUF58 family)
MNFSDPIPIVTKRNALLFLTTLALYAGYARGNEALFFLGELLLVVLIITYVNSVLLFQGLRVRRKHYPRTFEQQELFITLEFDTDSAIPHYLIEIADRVPPSQHYKVHSVVPSRFDRTNIYQMEYKARCVRKRGLYVLGPIELQCADPAGVFPRTLRVDTFTELLVYPQALDLKNFPVLGHGTLANVGTETTRNPGHSEEFVGLRDYQRGDSPRRIHWPSSARHNRLLVKEFQEDVVTEVTIFLDLYRLSLTGFGDVTSVEYLIKTAASVAKAAIEKSHRVQVFALGKQISHIPLGSGMQHLISILDRMTFYKAEGEGSFEEIFGQKVRHLRRGSTVILIMSATNFSLSRLRPTLRYLVISRIKIIVVLIDDRSFIKIWEEQEHLHASAPSLGELKRLLVAEGCTVYTLAKRDKIEQRLGLPNT